MTIVQHGPYDQATPERPTTVTTLVGDSHAALESMHKSLDILTQRLETILNRSDDEGINSTAEMMAPSTSLMCNELLKLNDGIDSATRRVNMLMARLEL